MQTRAVEEQADQKLFLDNFLMRKVRPCDVIFQMKMSDE
jgi:hypothetical protein